MALKSNVHSIQKSNVHSIQKWWILITNPQILAKQIHIQANSTHTTIVTFPKWAIRRKKPIDTKQICSKSMENLKPVVPTILRA